MWNRIVPSYHPDHLPAREPLHLVARDKQIDAVIHRTLQGPKPIVRLKGYITIPLEGSNYRQPPCATGANHNYNRLYLFHASLSV